MSVATILYLISVLDSLDNLVGLIIGLIVVGIPVAAIIIVTNVDDDTKRLTTLKYLYGKSIVITLIFLCLIAVLIPSERTMYLMVGGSYLQRSNIPSKVEQVINEKLDQYLQDERKVKK